MGAGAKLVAATSNVYQDNHTTHALVFGGGLAYAGYQAFMNLRPTQGIMPREPMTSQFTLGESRLDFKFNPDSHKSVRDGEV